MSKLNPSFDITTSFYDYNKLIKKAMVLVGTDVYLTFEPKERTVTEDNVSTIEKYVKCSYNDETSGYTHDFDLSRDDLRQLNALLSNLRTQLGITDKENNGETGCSRKVTIK